jgi:hypothetical protein
MNQNNIYVTDQISILQSEIHELKNRQVVTEVQLGHLLEERKGKRELRAEIWRELSLMMWFAVCFIAVVLFSLHHH